MTIPQPNRTTSPSDSRSQMSTQQPDIRSIPLAALTFSKTPAQAERRLHFSEEAMKELAESVEAEGIIQPIVVRPCPFREVDEEKFEIVAGERRVRACELAGLDTIPSLVRDLNDHQVARIQLIENLQREEVHPLSEALGYEELVHKHSYSVEQIAGEVGKSTAYVYARLKLLALSTDARKAFYAGKLSASTALLVARITGEELQLRALKEITDGGYHGDRVMTYREVQRYVHDTFMLKLSGAPFPRDDATLVPSAGACGPCPLRTGNQPELFDDVKSGDVCTSPACFQAKKAAHIKRELEKAKNTGERVIRGGDARRILPEKRSYYYESEGGSHKQLRNGYARPGDKCLDDPKKRTYAELAGKDAPRVLLQNPDSGRVEKVFEVAAIADQLKAKGIKVKPPAADKQEQREQDHEQQKRESKLEGAARRAIFQAILKAAPTALSHMDLAVLISRCAGFGSGDDANFYAMLGWPAPKGASKRYGGIESQRLFLKQLLDRTDAELAQLAVAVTAIDDATDDYGPCKELETLAQRFHIDTKKIRAAAAAAPPNPPKEEKKPKKKASKKAAKKK